MTNIYNNRKQFEVKIDKYKKTIKNESNPLLCACNSNQESTINYLIDNVYSSNKQDSNETKLFDINDSNANGKTALWFCCGHGNISSVSRIFERFGNSIDVNKCNNNGTSPFFACWLSKFLV